jgi:hypothetical protein
MTDELLNPKDARLLDAYIASGSLPAAADLVGIDRTTAWRRANKPMFQEELQRRLEDQRRRASTALLARQDAAWSAIDRSLASTDDRIQLRAAIWLLEHVMASASESASAVPTMVDVELEEARRSLLRQLRAGEKEAS